MIFMGRRTTRAAKPMSSFFSCFFSTAPITYLSPAVYSSALQHQIESSNPSRGRTIHAHILKTGFAPNNNISIKLLILHMRCGCLSNARKLFDEMTHPTVSAYSYIISGYFRSGQVGEMLNLVRKVRFSDEKSYWFVMSMILKVSVMSNLVNVAKQVHVQILKSKQEFDEVLFTSLVDSYAKNGRLDYARRVFEKLHERNFVCSTALITGYMNAGCVKDAEEIFESTVEKDVVVFNAMVEGYSNRVETCGKAFEIYKCMQRINFRPSISTFASIIGACSTLSALDLGQQVHCQLVKTDAFYHLKSGSALVDMYCKCGRTEDARRVFDYMPDKNVITWTSMIDGYGKNGRSSEALRLFYKMRKDSTVSPNYVTFLSALSACGHAGLVEDGKEILESMEMDYGIKPRMEHYACVVDLLGRAGDLVQAFDFIKHMPEKPNSDVWAAFLGACRLHHEVEMAAIAANELFKLSRDRRPGAYVALSNTFAAAGMWGSVCHVRDMMKERGVSKDSGQSWIGFQPNGQAPPSSTNKQISPKHKHDDSVSEYSRPWMLSNEIPQIINDFRMAAKNTIEAGFNGVEIHGAYGYLIEVHERLSIKDRQIWWQPEEPMLFCIGNCRSHC